MPNSRTHNVINILFIPLLLLLTSYLPIGSTQTAYLIGAYIFSCFMFNGDLDIHSSPYRMWFILKWYWIPYQRLIPHRSILSHGIIIGTVVRIIYCSPLIILFVWFFDINIWHINTLWILLGLELGNTIHTLADKTL